MNTKIVMTLCALILGIGGISMTFAPDVVLTLLNMEVHDASLFMMQIVGALYFAFAMLNWMAKSSLIGGIYNRPIAVANFTHFVIAGLSLIKGLASNPDLPLIIWIFGAIYSVFGLCFGVILFRHPIVETSKTS